MEAAKLALLVVVYAPKAELGADSIDLPGFVPNEAEKLFVVGQGSDGRDLSHGGAETPKSLGKFRFFEKAKSYLAVSGNLQRGQGRQAKASVNEFPAVRCSCKRVEIFSL